MAEQTTAIEALRQSLKLEQRGHKFYLDAAARTTDQRGREMLHSLADDELKHLQAIQRQLEALTAGQTRVTIGTVPDKPLDLEQALLPPDKETLEKTISA